VKQLTSLVDYWEFTYHLHGKPAIPVGKSNGLRHSIWEASENMGCDLRGCYFTAFRFFQLI